MFCLLHCLFHVDLEFLTRSIIVVIILKSLFIRLDFDHNVVVIRAFTLTILLLLFLFYLLLVSLILINTISLRDLFPHLHLLLLLPLSCLLPELLDPSLSLLGSRHSIGDGHLITLPKVQFRGVGKS